jgi:hypothetical protein
MEYWIALGLAIISLVLPIGWQWLRFRFISAAWSKQWWFGQTAEFFYFVGLPYVALVFGVLTPQQLGLKGLEYFSLVSPNSFISDVQRVFTLMVVEWLVDIGPMVGIGLAAALILSGIIFILTRYGVTEAQSDETILDTLYNTLHWAFYWALFWLLVDDLYLGILIGSGWAILEYFLLARMQQTRLNRQPQQLVKIMILIFTATIFFYRPNLWLLWPIHVVMVWFPRLICRSAISSERIKNLQ